MLNRNECKNGSFIIYLDSEIEYRSMKMKILNTQFSEPDNTQLSWFDALLFISKKIN